MIINGSGTYTLVYTATDACGNTTEVERTVIVREPNTFRTVLYTDGTLIINENSNDISSNIAQHGSAIKTYDPLDADHPYEFDVVPVSGTSADTPWYSDRHSITSIEIGSAIQPTTTKLWFAGLYNCTSIDLTLLDTSNVTDMSYMFYNCSSLTSLDLGNLDTSNVTNMLAMFYSCTTITTIDLSSFDTSNVEYMGDMFCNCDELTTIIASNTFVTTNVIDSSQMFYGDTNLVGGNGTVYDANYIDKTYARIDTAGTPGYFTASA